MHWQLYGFDMASYCLLLEQWETSLWILGQHQPAYLGGPKIYGPRRERSCKLQLAFLSFKLPVLNLMYSIFI